MKTKLKHGYERKKVLFVHFKTQVDYHHYRLPDKMLNKIIDLEV